ncbi:MAG: hypothetical protein ABF876_14975 [Acetobacter aceti]
MFETQKKIVQLRDVFGVGRDVPLNYVAREEVDNKFINNLSREKHVVIYGSSKQGKTSLRKHCLNEDDCIVISCLNTMSLSDLNGAILKSAGYRIEQQSTKTVGGAWKYSAEFSGEGKLPLVASASGKAGIENERDKSNSIQTGRLELDLGDVNDVISALKEIIFKKFIVLEDFHYLSADVQKSFSFSLKAYHENSDLCFIIVGVWREQNRLIYYNGDLTNRVISIDVDNWNDEDLRKVISIGEDLLNIKIDEGTVQGIIENCDKSVSLAQESCHRICEKFGISETQRQITEIGKDIDTRDLVKNIVSDQSGRYSAFITNFSEGFQQTGLEMYKWLIYSVIVTPNEDLEDGLRRAKISSTIKEKHPEGMRLNEGNITQALQNTAPLQVQKSIRPIILDYDQTTKSLTVVDRSFLIWLNYQDRGELILEIGVN